MNFTPDPVAFSVFGLDIRWYAILVCGGMILAALVGILRAPRHEIDRDGMLDVILISVIVGVIGARAWYVFFNRDMYDSFLDVINIRAGGLAIHGGLIFGSLAAVIVCLIKKYHPVEFLDLAFPCVALGQAIGRWGNFFNQEAYGTETNLPWAIVVDGKTVHPTFLYESIWCFILFIILLIVDRHRRYRGQTFLLYGVLYSIERFVVEQFRTDSLLAGPLKLVKALREAGYDPTGIDGVKHIGNLLLYPFRTAQGVSLAVAVICFILLRIFGYIADRKEDEEYDDEYDDEYYDDDFYDDDEYELSRREQRKRKKEQKKLEKERKKLGLDPENLEDGESGLAAGVPVGSKDVADIDVDDIDDDDIDDDIEGEASEGQTEKGYYEDFSEDMPYEMTEEDDFTDTNDGLSDGQSDDASADFAASGDGLNDGQPDDAAAYFADAKDGLNDGQPDDAPADFADADDGLNGVQSGDASEDFADADDDLNDGQSDETSAEFIDMNDARSDSSVGSDGSQVGYHGLSINMEDDYPEEPEKEWYETEDEPEDEIMTKLREKYSLKKN